MAYLKIPSTGITVSGNVTEVLTSPLNKLWRAKILLNRSTSGMPQNEGYTQGMPKVSPPTNKEFQDAKKEENFLAESSRHTNEDTPLSSIPKRQYNNQIIIINPNTSPYTKIIIQGMPSEVEVNPESNWAVVKSMGRNNPFMFYTGGEDIISFDISWYSVQKDREDVLNKCRLLESWTRANGYKSSPPILYISWGSSNLFKNDTFVLTSAKYTLSNFQNATRSTRGKYTGSGDQLDLKLLPNCAIQHLVFKKVTSDNVTHEQIISKEKIANTKGIIQ